MMGSSYLMFEINILAGQLLSSLVTVKGTAEPD